MNRILKKKIILLLIIVLFVIIGSVISYRMFISSTTSSEDALYSKVSGLIELPTEAPTIATVSDHTKLSSQAFFSKALNGDKVLIFQQAKKAILYRPSTNKIIEVGPLQLPEATQPIVPTLPLSEQNEEMITPTPTVARVVILNATKTGGLAKTTQKVLTDNKNIVGKIQVIRTGNAKGNYTKTIIFDATGIHADVTSQLAQQLKGEVVTKAPSEEEIDDLDILIIVSGTQ